MLLVTRGADVASRVTIYLHCRRGATGHAPRMRHVSSDHRNVALGTFALLDSKVGRFCVTKKRLGTLMVYVSKVGYRQCNLPLKLLRI